MPLTFKEFVVERCWPGYKPAPGKTAYSKGSCVREEATEQLDEMPGANMDTRAIHAYLKKKGWSLSRTAGSHDVYTHEKAGYHISVPRHKQLKAPLVRGILKQADMREEIISEMDKSAPQPGRDGKISHSTYGSRDKEGSDYFKGKESPAKAITVKQAKKDALDIMRKLGMAEDWQKVNRQDKTDGLSPAAVKAYRRENPGSKLQTAVTEKNPKGKRAKRRLSFCRRMKGMKARLTSAENSRDPDSPINKALRRWNC